MPAETTAARLRKVREKATERGARAASVRPEIIPRALVDAIGAEKASAALRGDKLGRDLQAILHKDEVIRMSRASVPVKTIAAELGLSYRHVVALRSLLGVGRRR